MTTWNIGKVVEHKHWSKTLHTLYVESDIEPFEAGQFIKLGLEVNGEVIGRPYSLVNSPDSRPLEFYYIEVPNGPLTSRLVKLSQGDSILVMPRAHGFMILDEVPIAKNLWLMCTGTGVGPFYQFSRLISAWQRYEQVVLVYAVRTLSELSYRDRINSILANHPGQFSFIPFISRESSGFALSGRIPQSIIDGRLRGRRWFKNQCREQPNYALWQPWYGQGNNGHTHAARS